MALEAIRLLFLIAHFFFSSNETLLGIKIVLLISCLRSSFSFANLCSLKDTAGLSMDISVKKHDLITQWCAQVMKYLGL